MSDHNILAFPNFAAALGGAQSVRYSRRYAWITTARGTIVRLALSSLPDPTKWTAFNLADAAHKAGAK